MRSHAELDPSFAANEWMLNITRDIATEVTVNKNLKVGSFNVKNVFGQMKDVTVNRLRVC